MATDFTVNKADLEFILKQIKIAEATSLGYTPAVAPVTILQAIMTAYGLSASDAALAPFGLRTVDGTFNSLIPGQSDFGAADTLFPRLTDPVYRNDMDGDTMPLGPFPAPVITNTNYDPSIPGSHSVADADPRIISNLIVDMTAGNPAAIGAALKYSVFTGAITEDQVAAAAAAIETAYLITKNANVAAGNAQVAAAAEAAALLVLNPEILQQADALVAYNAAVLADAGNAAAAALADVSDAAAAAAKAAVDALFSSIIVDTDSPFDGILNVNPLDFTNMDAAVLTAGAAHTAASDVVAALALAHPELTDAEAVKANAEALYLALQVLQTALVDTEVSSGDGAALVAAQLLANSNVTGAQALTADLDALVGLGAVATTLADLNFANGELAGAQLVYANAVAASNAADAAAAAAPGALNAALDLYGIEHDPLGSLVIPNLSPDIGLSPGFNSWMTFFGQFFDHGLDLVTKGGNGTVYIPLQADDPLIAGADGILGNADDLPAHLQFMALTRATPFEGGQENTTTSFVDQNQTYTSHPSHQVFLREYVMTATGAVSTGKMLDGSTATGSHDGAIGNWAEVKAQALTMLGISLNDFDVHNVPLLLTDQYGKFIPVASGPNAGYAQMVMAPDLTHATNWLKEGTAAGITTAGSIGTNHAFLNDIAHHAAPSVVDHDHDGGPNPGNPSGTPKIAQIADADIDANGNGIYDAGDTLTDVNGDGFITTADLFAADYNTPGVAASGQNELTYDDEMLNAHMITGDGRGNENIALTTVHSIFHSEHNRLVDANRATILATADLAFINEWLVNDIASLAAIDTPAEVNALVWDGERLFQAARFATEMQYQHMVFEEFARRMQPMVDPFIFNTSPDLDPSIVAEFAHTVYRFGHSMLTGTVDRLDNDLNLLNGDLDQKSLLAVFLNPQAYIGSGATLEEVNANIIRGLSRDVGNAIDEFIVQDVRSNLLGLPLDLAVLNLARGRETGIPSLNETRAQLYNDTGLADLKPYTSWSDFALNIKNAASVVNFIAAYGTHASITGATTLANKRAAAEELVFGVDGPDAGSTVPGDRLDFLNATGAYAGDLGGLNLVDLWIGGLAERSPEFGGMLGTTFNYVFEFQMESLQFGDRMYYLTRTQGTNFLNNLEPNTFADIVMRNTELGGDYSTHLNGQLFVTPDYIIELDRGIAQTDYSGSDSDGTNDPLADDPILGAQVVRDYTGSSVVDGHDFGGTLRVLGGNHYVLGGTEGADRIYGDSGMDTLWGDGGNDYLNGGTEADDVFGGAGDDIIEDPFGEGDVLRGNDGNDVVTSARGADLLFGNAGQDYIVLGQDAAEVFGGEGTDFILGGMGKDFLMGNEGDDWIEGGGGFDTIAGENTELFFNSPIIGHDVLFGHGDETDYDAESGDDIMGSGPSVYRYEGMFGFDWGIAKYDVTGVRFDLQIPVFTTIPTDVLRDRFDQTEALSGWKFDDVLDGDDRGHKGGGSSAPDSVPTELFADHLLTQEGINRIAGLNQWFGGNANGTMDSTDARITLFGGVAGVPGSTPISTFRDGNILMGGDGNDFLRGRGGYDLLDGDAWLNVRIKIVVNGVTYSAESMTTDTTVMGQYAGKVYNTFADGSANFNSVAFGGASLTSLMLDRTINPGDMSIVREILDGTVGVNERDTDTAIFQGTRAEYDIEGITVQVNGNGNADDTITYTGSAQDMNGDGFISVRDRDTGAVGATVWQVIDGVATQVQLSSSRGALTDDTDLLKNIEQLQFADQLLVIGGNNQLAKGTVTIQDPTMFQGLVTPYVGQVLTATLTGVTDGNGIVVDANGTPTGPYTFEWQTTEFGNNSGWSTIQTSLTYTVRSVDPGHVLRAVAVFEDGQGNPERIISAATDNPTTAYSVNENSTSGAVVAARIPFSIDYDPEPINGQPPADVDLATLHHEIDPLNNAGGRFTVVAIPGQVDFQGTPLYQIQVANGGPQFLNYEAPVHTPANLSHQFVDNQYQVVINTYDAPGGTLVAVRQFTVFLNDVGDVASIAPVLDLHADAAITTPTPFPQAYRDTFDTAAFNNTNGTTTWTTSWSETGDNLVAATGEITLNLGQLRFNPGSDNDDAITRSVNGLPGDVASATLSFNYQSVNLDNGILFDRERVIVEARNSTTGVWTQIGDLGGNTTATFSASIPLSLIGANTQIRFRVDTDVTLSLNSTFEINESFSIDNVNIAITRNIVTTVPGTPGNNYATTFTEPGTLDNGTPVAIALNPAMSDFDNTSLMGATIKLTNAKPLDALTIAGTLTGITSTIDSSVPGVITLYLSGPATYAALQTAIGQVRYSNTSQDPDTTTRIIQVTVNDGEKESIVAEATITVTAMNDPPVTVNDAIITNFANGASFTIPEWALLANDSDPDSPTIDVTAVGGATNLTGLSLNDGSVTMAHTAAGNSSFTYTGSDGSLTDDATASVARSVASSTYSETFGSTSYTDDDGAWTQNWAETGDDGSSTLATGQIRITNNELEFDVGDGASLTRGINLAGMTSATLSFEVDQNGLDAGETVLVQFDADGNGVFETLLSTINSGSSTNGATTTVNLVGGTANSAIRFLVSGINTAGENVQIDNINITYTAPSTNIVAGAGNQILVGDDAASSFTGGADNDIILAGAGNDTILYTIGDGADTVDGQDNADTLAIIANGGAHTLDVIYNGASITNFEGGTVTNVEAVTADLGGGTDRLSYAGTLAAIAVNLTAGTAMGFTSISNIENVTGGDGDDTLTGSTAANNLIGGLGNDTFNYAIGGGADTIDGGADGDTLSITDGGGNNTLDVLFNGSVITSVEGGTITSIETINVNMGGASDTISFAGSTSGVTVNLAGPVGTSGITSLLSVANAVGTAQADTLTGGAGANILTGGGGADTISLSGDVADALDIVRFSATGDFGDTITNFDSNGIFDRVDFGGALNTAWDDGNSDDNFLFVSGNGGAGTVNATVGQADANAEALFLSGGIAAEGVINTSLLDATAVANAFNAEFNITAANGEDALLVINDTDGNSATVWQWIQAGGGEIDAAELTLIAKLNANATVTAASFDFFG